MTEKQWPDFRPSTWRSKENGSIDRGVRISTRRSRIYIPRSQLIELANLCVDVHEGENE